MYVVESQGLSGGIIVAWHQGIAKIDVFNCSNQQVAIVISENRGPTWLLSRVYASNNQRERRVVWQEVSAMIDLGIPSVVVGDFNCILEEEDKRGGRPFVEDRATRELANFIQDCGLVDLGFVGPRFTWCNNQSGRARVWEQIDRCLATSNWLQLNPDHLVHHLPRIASNHYPLLLTTSVLTPVMLLSDLRNFGSLILSPGIL